MKIIVCVFSALILVSCNQQRQADPLDTSKSTKYYDAEKLHQLTDKCIHSGDSESFGNLVDYYGNNPSEYYELLPISMIMADKYNNDNARVTIYFQMIMMNDEGKRDDSSFFKLNKAKQDFIVSYLTEGVLNGNPGCKSIMRKITKGGYKLKEQTQKIDSLLILK